MKEEYNISIPEPCHEDWNKMEPAEQGKFCKSCCKTVVDFTKKNRSEIDQYFSSRPREEICGRYKTIHAASSLLKKKYFISGKFISFFLLISTYLFSTGCYIMGKRTDSNNKKNWQYIPTEQDTTTNSNSHFKPVKNHEANPNK